MTVFDINTQQLSTSQHLFKGSLAIERIETHDIVHWILSTIPAGNGGTVPVSRIIGVSNNQ